jgi:hypothetical protein
MLFGLGVSDHRSDGTHLKAYAPRGSHGQADRLQVQRDPSTVEAETDFDDSMHIAMSKES